MGKGFRTLFIYLASHCIIIENGKGFPPTFNLIIPTKTHWNRLDERNRLMGVAWRKDGWFWLKSRKYRFFWKLVVANALYSNICSAKCARISAKCARSEKLERKLFYYWCKNWRKDEFRFMLEFWCKREILILLSPEPIHSSDTKFV